MTETIVASCMADNLLALLGMGGVGIALGAVGCWFYLNLTYRTVLRMQRRALAVIHAAGELGITPEQVAAAADTRAENG